MGHMISTYITEPDVMPVPESKPTYDPLYGFPNGRKARELKVSVDELKSLKIPFENRDYCADKIINMEICRGQNYPFVYKCAHEKHQYLQCQYEDYVLRMKEYEREKRLKKRAKRVQG